MAIENEAAKELINYGAIGVILVGALWALIKMALNFKRTTDQHQERIDRITKEHQDRLDKKEREYQERLDKKDSEHESRMNELISQSREERERIQKAYEENTRVIRDLYLVIEKRAPFFEFPSKT